MYKAIQLNYYYRFSDDISSMNVFNKILEYAVKIYGNSIQLNINKEMKTNLQLLFLI